MKIGVVIVSERREGRHDLKRTYVLKTPSKMFLWVRQRIIFLNRKLEREGRLRKWSTYRNNGIHIYTNQEYEIFAHKTSFFKVKKRS